MLIHAICALNMYLHMPLQHLYRTSPTGEALLYAWFQAMHTRVDVALYGTYSEEHLLGIAGQIEKELQRLENIGNYFDPTSELSQTNRLAYTHTVPVSHELYRMLTLCKEAYQRTQGYFDVTIHSERHNPDTMHSIKLSAEAHTLRFDQPGICIDLSGFLKGYALDSIRSIVEQSGICHALINLGNSSILALGNHPTGQGWKLDEGIVLTDQCLTTSGNEREERIHIINPQTGHPIAGKRQIRVITPQGMWGEVCSTALFACPDQQRPALIEALRPELIQCYMA